jgi:hypothetical protein
MQIIWKASESASCLHATVCLADGYAAADHRLAEAFAPAVDFAQSEFATCGVPADRWFPKLLALSASGVESNQQLVDQTIAKLSGRGSAAHAFAGRLAGCIGGLKSAYQTAYRETASADAPPLVDELLLRGRPLAEQWEARGPGMLWHLGKLTDDGLLVEQANVVLVQPILGGHGMAHLKFNVVTLEAVLTNPIEALPEVVRLAWLVAQLNLDLPKYAELIPAERREQVGRLAMVPPVLAAAEHVELGPLTNESIARALVGWRLVDTTADEAAKLAETLRTWWKTYQEGTTRWEVALAALDEMLAG